MQYGLTYNSYNSWTLPLNLAIGFHILVAVSIVVLPDLLKPRPKFEDIYTVNLVNISEIAPQQEVAQPEPAPAPPEPVKPVETKEAVAIAEPIKPVEPPKPAKPVSIKPLKRKVKKKVVKKPDPQRQQELQRKTLADALKAEQEAARQARLAAEEAARQQKLLEENYRQIQKQTASIAKNTTSSSANTNRGARSNRAADQYGANLKGRIMQFWSLPQFKTWDDSIEAIVTIRISPSGKITKQRFVQKSSDPTFDQFVRRTLQSATPLPPIPRALKNELDQDIDLRFSPSGIR